jgi:hypothetical protein
MVAWGRCVTTTWVFGCWLREKQSTGKKNNHPTNYNNLISIKIKWVVLEWPMFGRQPLLNMATKSDTERTTKRSQQARQASKHFGAGLPLVATKKTGKKKSGHQDNSSKSTFGSSKSVPVDSLSRAFSEQLSLVGSSKHREDEEMSAKRGLAVGSNTNPLAAGGKCGGKCESVKATEKRQKLGNTTPELVAVPSGDDDANKPKKLEAIKQELLNSDDGANKRKKIKALKEQILNELMFTGKKKTGAWEHPIKDEAKRQELASTIVDFVAEFHENKAIDKCKLLKLNPDLKHVLKDKKFGSTINQMSYGIAAWGTYQYIYGELEVYPKKNDTTRLCDMRQGQRNAAEKFIKEYMAPLDKDLVGDENALEGYIAEVMKWNIHNMRENLRKKISRYGVWAAREDLTESETNGVYVYHFFSVANFDHTLFEVRERYKERKQREKDTTERAEDTSM